jgi:hypothetical protein
MNKMKNASCGGLAHSNTLREFKPEVAQKQKDFNLAPHPARTPPSNVSSMLEIASFNETPAKI